MLATSEASAHEIGLSRCSTAACGITSGDPLAPSAEGLILNSERAVTPFRPGEPAVARARSRLGSDSPGISQNDNRSDGARRCDRVLAGIPRPFAAGRLTGALRSDGNSTLHRRHRAVRTAVPWGDPSDDGTSNDCDDEVSNSLDDDDNSDGSVIASLQEKVPYLIPVEYAPATARVLPSSPFPAMQRLRC
jgi:hypothetical protein